MAATGEYQKLIGKVHAFFARVTERYPQSLACASGCSDCCQGGLSVTAVEAQAITVALRAMSPGQRDHVLTLAARPPGPSCAALDAAGRCSIYAARPVVCRSHGVPLKLKSPGVLPIVDCCPKNFTSLSLDSVDADCVLDQDTISTLLAAVNQQFCREQGRAGDRIDLRMLLQEAAGAPA